VGWTRLCRPRIAGAVGWRARIFKTRLAMSWRGQAEPLRNSGALWHLGGGRGAPAYWPSCTSRRVGREHAGEPNQDGSRVGCALKRRMSPKSCRVRGGGPGSFAVDGNAHMSQPEPVPLFERRRDYGLCKRHAPGRTEILSWRVARGSCHEDGRASPQLRRGFCQGRRNDVKSWNGGTGGPHETSGGWTTAGENVVIGRVSSWVNVPQIRSCWKSRDHRANVDRVCLPSNPRRRAPRV